MLEPGLLLLRLVVVGGLAVWLTLILINVITDRKGTVASVALIMTMNLIAQDNDTHPLLRRRIESRFWHVIGAVAIMTLQAITVVLLWRGTVLLLSDASASALSTQTVTAVQQGLTAFAALWLFMLMGGMWFVYWLKQPGLQQLHLTLLLVAIATGILFSVA
ncbi:hypothetical protein MA04_01319 [Alcanivorax balearicus MACL04]|uniref:Uncharacterized protein n=1 Tax=Alloalcanivorax balearicus MACL04 TaxID=1177182 RepID=A0ABT2QWV7_9GAMM|nr:DUF2165 family protein [Alloalcanivorax balearicus]MCU5782019.1 hypothetical protein [Alloalcanivorax balearicus MACL04]